VRDDPAAKARALAFEDMYRNYANPLVNHHLTPEDLEDVRQSVRPKIIEYLRDQGAEFSWAFLDRTIQSAVEQASTAFLSI
jgi:hypothetical protein